MYIFIVDLICIIQVPLFKVKYKNQVCVRGEPSEKQSSTSRTRVRNSSCDKIAFGTIKHLLILKVKIPTFTDANLFFLLDKT